MLRKKLYGFFAFFLVIARALGLTFALSACSNDKDNSKDNSDLDPIIGTWKGNVAFGVSMGFLDLGEATADTTIVVDEQYFSLTIRNVDLGNFNSFVNGPMFTDEDYVAIYNATWAPDDTGDGKYHAYANITGTDYDIPIQVMEEDGSYVLVMDTSIDLTVAGYSITAKFNNATIMKYSNDTTQPDVDVSESDTEASCTCGEGCTCGENCECEETCVCEDCGTSENEEGCTCDDECNCDEDCECGEECECEECSSKSAGDE